MAWPENPGERLFLTLPKGSFDPDSDVYVSQTSSPRVCPGCIYPGCHRWLRLVDTGSWSRRFRQICDNLASAYKSSRTHADRSRSGVPQFRSHPDVYAVTLPRTRARTLPDCLWISTKSFRLGFNFCTYTYLPPSLRFHRLTQIKSQLSLPCRAPCCQTSDLYRQLFG